jgi:hypothetical protein
MFRETELRTFIDGTCRFFETLTAQAASVGSPYLVTDGKPGAYEFAGVIEVSGARKGMVYFTAPRGMLAVLLMRMQETDTSEENMRGRQYHLRQCAPRSRQRLRDFRAERAGQSSGGRGDAVSACLRDSHQLAHARRQARGLPAVKAGSISPKFWLYGYDA